LRTPQVEVGHNLISRVTDAVLDDVREWQAWPLEDVYPILFLDTLIVKVRDGGAVRNLARYAAIGVNLEGGPDQLPALPTVTSRSGFMPG
jgi:putative transposase